MTEKVQFPQESRLSSVKGISLIKVSASTTLLTGDVSLVCLSFYWSSQRTIATTGEKPWQVSCQVDCSLLQMYLMSSLSIHVPHVKLCIGIHKGSLCFDFSVAQSLICRSRVQYVWDRGKNRDYTFILTSLFHDYSLIRGFYCEEYS